MKSDCLWDGPIVDAHQHFWDPHKNYHPWLSPEAMIPFRYGDYTAIKKRYLPCDYQAETRQHNIIQTVYVETEWDPNDPVGECVYATRLNEDYGLPNAVVAQAWLNKPEAESILQQQVAFKLVRSVRHKPGGVARPDEAASFRTLMSDDKWRKGYAYLSRYGLSFDLQVSWWHLDEAVLLARDFPETTIILNHAGLPADRSISGIEGWHRALGKLATMPNVAVKISGLGQVGKRWTVEANRYIIEEVIAMFGADRTMFASNFPVDSLCGSFDEIFRTFKLIAAQYGEKDQYALFCGTALKYYRLPQVEDQTTAGTHVNDHRQSAGA